MSYFQGENVWFAFNLGGVLIREVSSFKGVLTKGSTVIIYNYGYPKLSQSAVATLYIGIEQV